MWIPTKSRKLILRKLFNDGVLVAEQNLNFRVMHPQFSEIPNLHVVKAMKSLQSSGYVKEQFCWRHYYWTITNEGIEHLRKVLNIPSTLVPSTLMKQTTTVGLSQTSRPMAEPRPYNTGAYRSDPEKSAGPGAVGITMK